MLEWLEKWYLSHCNGDWEHGYGIKIETTDNPGWSLFIYLEGTNVNLPDVNWRLNEISDHDWYGYKIENNIYKASGDPMKLELLISLFKDLVEKEE